MLGYVLDTQTRQPVEGVRVMVEQNGAFTPSAKPTLTDAKMRPQEWITGPRSLLKTDFEHHGLGKNELNVTDPAYDLAEAILHLGLSELEEGRFLSRYIEESGDTRVKERLLLNKLLAGTIAMSTALTNLADGRLAHRAQEFNRLYIDAWNFLIVHTARVCGGAAQQTGPRDGDCGRIVGKGKTNLFTELPANWT